MKKWTIFSFLLALLLTGCVESAAEPTGSPEQMTLPEHTASVSGAADVSADAAITLNGTGALSDSAAVKISGGTVTITEAGRYLVSGTLERGMILVDAEKTDEITLILNGADIQNPTGAAIYVRKAGKLTVESVSGSVNLLSNGGTYTQTDDNNVDAVLFSKSDVSLEGTGTLVIQAEAGHGVVSKDSLRVESGVYEISAAGHGLAGKDGVEISGGEVLAVTGKDGIHAENADDAAAGNLTIGGGQFRMEAAGDGLSASGDLTIEDGVFQISTGGESSEDTSTKGIKADGTVTVRGGIYTIHAADDGMHANGDIQISGGEFTVTAGDDGIHADGSLAITGGEITVSDSYEGLEGLNVEISGGNIRLTASDDGINAAGGNDQSGFGGRGPDTFRQTDGDCGIGISGGTITINAEGDGMDSNGSLLISGGTVYISGTTARGNGALDYAGAGTISGGTVIAVSGGGMEQNFDASSTQGAIAMNVGAQPAGAAVTIMDADGGILACCTPEKAYSAVVISCPGLESGKTYTVTAGETGQTVTMDGLIYGSAGMGVGGEGRPGGMEPGGEGRPGGMGPGGEERPGGMDFGGGDRPGAPEFFGEETP